MLPKKKKGELLQKKRTRTLEVLNRISRQQRGGRKPLSKERYGEEKKIGPPFERAPLRLNEIRRMTGKDEGGSQGVYLKNKKKENKVVGAKREGTLGNEKKESKKRGYIEKHRVRASEGGKPFGREQAVSSS